MKKIKLIKFDKLFFYILIIPFLCLGQETQKNYEEVFIKTINEEEFVREDYKGELINSRYLVWNNGSLANQWKYLKRDMDMEKKTKFLLLPKSIMGSKDIFKVFNKEDYIRILKQMIFKEIEYSIKNTQNFENLLEQIIESLNKSIDIFDESNTSCTLYFILPKKLNPKSKKKPKRSKEQIVTFLIIPYLSENGDKVIRIFNAAKITSYQKDLALNVLIGGKENCTLCSRSSMLSTIKNWGEKEYILEINNKFPNEIINVAKDFSNKN